MTGITLESARIMEINGKKFMVGKNTPFMWLITTKRNRVSIWVELAVETNDPAIAVNQAIAQGLI